jgi:hypothetical protein
MLGRKEMTMTINRTYYTLATRTDGKWSPQFGDYSRKVVAQEADDTYWNRNGGAFRSKDMKIIATIDRQFDINAAISHLNGEPVAMPETKPNGMSEDDWLNQFAP